MAKAAQPQELNINLLQKEEIAGSTGAIINWVLNIGRYFIIATEIVALLTFVFGINLSADKNNIKQAVKVAQIEVDNKSACDPNDLEKFCEDRFRTLQNKFNLISSYRSGQFRQNLVINELLKRLPSGVLINNLSINEGKITFSGSFPTAVHLQTLINSFNSDDSKINDLDIQELTSPTTTDPNFSFKAVASINRVDFKETTIATGSGESN